MAGKVEQRTYQPMECVVFRKTAERYGGLSNMAPGFPLRVNGIVILTSEALYQACRFPHRPDVQQMIIEQTSPMTAKMKSKPFRGESRPDWDRIRVTVMRWCLRVKLSQNWDSFGRLLLSTGSVPIVEESRKDDFWGAKEKEGLLVGCNVLGRLLMELREHLQGPNSCQLRKIAIPKIHDFYLFGRPLTAIPTTDLINRDLASLFEQ